MLAVEELSVAYGGVRAVSGLSLTVEPGEVLALLGPNGAGKTTLVSIVAGLRKADAGVVEVAGIDALGRSKEARRLIGLAPQDIGIYPVVSVRQNLRLFGELAGVRRGSCAGGWTRWPRRWPPGAPCSGARGRQNCCRCRCRPRSGRGR